VVAIRSVLWIGSGDHFEAGVVADAPSLDVVWERDVQRASKLVPQSFHVVVLDALSACEARESLAALALPPSVPALVRLEDFDDVDASALRGAGAADVVHRDPRGAVSAPDFVSRLDRLVNAARSERRSEAANPRRPFRRETRPPAGLVGDGPAMQEVFSLLEVASRARATVLVTGETGTGKELVARAIHDASPRRRGPFVAVNCAAFPDTLLESELFGHMRGAFTGADRDKAGLFEAASGGTLFLDEVGETSPSFQAKLLRVLQEREVRRIGGSSARPVDARVVTATNRDLSREAQRGAFREDLYYRLAVFPIRLPPLRERARDVLPLARHFIARHSRLDGRPEARLSEEAARLLQAYDWPGNVRELENEMERAVALAEAGQPITPELLSKRIRGILEPIEATALEAGETLRTQVGRIEAWLIRRALASHSGRRAETARRLGITREGLYKKMKRLGIE